MYSGEGTVDSVCWRTVRYGGATYAHKLRTKDLSIATAYLCSGAPGEALGAARACSAG